MEDIIKKSVSDFVGAADSVEAVAKLYGDASYRTYFRTRLASGKTVVVMKMPKGRSSVSEEITNYKGAKEELPYINVSNYLKKIGAPVPEILYYDKERDVLVLEDIGDRQLFQEVSSADDEQKFAWYKKAIDLLCEIQKKAQDDGRCMVFKRSFDEVLLNWEFDHFLEWCVEARTGKKVDDKLRKRFTEITREITGEIMKMDYIFTHRDYQSRNLMIRDSKIYVLDFQDALLGPKSYDMVALTRDSYVKISDELLDKLIAHYCAKSGVAADEFRREFDLVTIQRKMKDAGRFVYIDRVKGNPNYLVHIPQSLEYVKKAILRQPKYKELFEITKPYVPEWNS